MSDAIDNKGSDIGLLAGGSRYLDLYAAALSTLCLVHCLVLPMLASLLPVLGLLSENEWVHKALVLLAIPATLLACWSSMSRRQHPGFVAVALAGLSLLLLAAFAESLAAFEVAITTAGALLLATAHGWRWANHRNKPGCHSSDEHGTNRKVGTINPDQRTRSQS